MNCIHLAIYHLENFQWFDNVQLQIIRFEMRNV